MQWLDVMKAVDVTAPRVGVVVWDNGDILEAVRTLYPNHVVCYVVVCRDMDRMMGPNCRPIPVEKVLGVRWFASEEGSKMW